MDIIKAILILVLAGALWRLYHKIFKVVYFDALGALLREIVISVLIAGIIVLGAFNAIGSIFHPKEADPDYFGVFYNNGLVQGNSAAEVMLTIGENESDAEVITISGYATYIGANYVQSFDASIPRPSGNTFTCYDEWHSSTITITFNSASHTLSVDQETTDSTVPTPFTGSYVDDETWSGLLEKRRAIKQAILDALEARKPDKWIENYFGTYTLLSYAQNEEGAPHIWFSIYSNNEDSFRFENMDGGEIDTNNTVYLKIPYPRGDAEPGQIECTLNEPQESVQVAFDVLGTTDDGRQLIEVTAFPYSEYLGLYVAGSYENDVPEETDPDPLESEAGFMESTIDKPYWEGNEAIPDVLEPSQQPMETPEIEQKSWNGTYTCNHGGDDGIKTLTISQSEEGTITFQMTHNYGDGRTVNFNGVAEIGTYNNGPYFASYEGGESDRTMYFTLLDNKSIEVAQVNIVPDIDLDFDGIYVNEG